MLVCTTGCSWLNTRGLSVYRSCSLPSHLDADEALDAVLVDGPLPHHWKEGERDEIKGNVATYKALYVTIKRTRGRKLSKNAIGRKNTRIYT